MITIVDYNAGNLRSVKRACDAVGLQAEFTTDPERVLRASRIIFPGVGHAKSCMTHLERSGIKEALATAQRRGTPILGICVGAQLLLDGSEEGPVAGMGWFPGQTRRFPADDPQLKIPHIGWNEINIVHAHPLLESVRADDAFYFVHSYYMAPSEPHTVLAETEYGDRFCSAIGRDNVFATQFHPEKSGRAGLALLTRFASWEGTPC